ncbi:DnaB-like helicase N-terminal domain-containing protein [Streptomyces sp. Da 82-17]|uniref:DnaB-like helicase N-terminal domain-containing protein n=1 Tax=Streptomyces sp. Da 82-17 TaxID=3377116 RepID=UPI0038D40829
MTPLDHAEQAVLGALFLEPAQLDQLAAWLKPEHFAQPTHSALHTAMLKLRAADHPAADTKPRDPVPLTWVNATLKEASRHTRGITATYAHHLISACPRPDHAPVYGRMVLEGATHRTVARHATRLHQAALADMARGAADETVHHAQILSEVLADLAHRWGTNPRPLQPPTSHAPAADAATTQVEEQVLADEEFLLGCLSARPDQLLGCLSARPDQLLDAVRSLRPSDFADAGHQQIYRSLGALHHRGEPIDQLTVLWEVQRRGALADGTLDTERVLKICAPQFGGAAEYLGEQVVQASLVRTAALAARQVRALANRDALAPGHLIGYALHALGPLDDVRHRLGIAHGAESAPPRRAERSGSPPPAARTDAARARSAAHHARPSAERVSHRSSTAKTDRPHRRIPF